MWQIRSWFRWLRSQYAKLRASPQRATKTHIPSPLRLEVLEARQVLAAPVVSFTGSGGSVLDSLSQLVSWNVTDPDGDLASTTVSFVRGASTIGTSTSASGSFAFDSFGTGNYTLQVFAIDNSAATTLATRTILVNDDDAAPPTISVTGTTGVENDGATNHFSWQIADVSSVFRLGVLVTRDGSTILNNNSSLSGTFNFDTFGLGVYQLQITATDNDNDWSGDRAVSSFTRTVTITDDDVSAPAVTFVGSAGTEDDGQLQQVVVTVNDPSTLDQIFVKVYRDGLVTIQQQILATGTINFDATGTGTYQIVVETGDNDVDWLGDDLNVTALHHVTVTDDDPTPPTVTFAGSTGVEDDGLPNVFVWNVLDVSEISSYAVSLTRNGAVLATLTALRNSATAFRNTIFGSNFFTLSGNPTVGATGTYNLNTFGLGTYQLTLTATDNDTDFTYQLGDRAITTTVTSVTVIDDDTDPPVLSFVGSSSGTENDGQTQQVIFDAPDNSGISQAVMTVRHNGVKLHEDTLTVGAIVPHTFNLDAFGLGTLAITVAITDNDSDWVGDALNIVGSTSFVVTDDDNTAPTISFAGSSGSESDSLVNQVFWETADASGIASTSIRLLKNGTIVRNSATTASSGTIDFNALGLGTYQVTIITFDNDNDWSADSLASTAHHFVTVTDDDSTPPSITFVGSSGVQGDGQPQSIAWQASDPSGVGSSTAVLIRNGVTISTQTTTAGSGTFSFDAFGLGAYQVRVVSTDADAEFASDVAVGTASHVVTVTDDDSAGPLINLAGSVTGTENDSQTQEIAWQISDPSGLASLTVTLFRNAIAASSLTTTASSGTFNFDAFGAGTYQIVFLATDSDNDWALDIASSSEVRSVIVGTNLPLMQIHDIRTFETGQGLATFSFPVTLSIPSVDPITVEYFTSEGTAKYRGDLLDTTGIITFNPGETTQFIPIQVRGDVFRENNETFTVTLGNSTNAGITRQVATAIIRNDEDGVGTYSATGSFSLRPGDTSFSFGSVGDTPFTGDWNDDGWFEVGVWRAGTFYFDTNGSGSFDGFDMSRTFGLASDLPFVGDWNGDGITEMGVRRRFVNYLDLNNDGLFTAADTSFSFGSLDDTPLVGDWNGDGSDDVGVWRNSVFFLDSNGNRAFDPGETQSSFGSVTDKPVIGDWNGDGRDDIGVYRNGTYFLDSNGNFNYDPGVDRVVTGFGTTGSLPVVGDWTGDRVYDVGMVANTVFTLDLDTDYRLTPTNLTFGPAAATPLLGDWNGDGRDDLGTWQNGVFSLDRNGNRAADAGDLSFGFGSVTDKPIAGDWNGDGISDIGIFRNGVFYLDSNGNFQFDAGLDAVFHFGSAGDTPIVGDWNGDQIDDIGVWRNGVFFLDDNGSRGYDTGVDIVAHYGSTTDTPIIGDWDSDGRDQIGIWRSSLFILDLDGSFAYEALEDIPFTFGSASDKPISGRW